MSKAEARGRWVQRIVCRVDSLVIDRSPEWCVTHWWMKRAYFDHARRESVMVAWPLNYAVQVAWMLNLAWSRYRHKPSWIDKQLSRQERDWSKEIYR